MRALAIKDKVFAEVAAKRLVQPKAAIETNLAPQLIAQSGHSDSVTGIAFSPVGKFVVSASVDNTLKLWDVRTGRKLRTLLGHKGAVRSVFFRLTGKSLCQDEPSKR